MNGQSVDASTAAAIAAQPEAGELLRKMMARIERRQSPRPGGAARGLHDEFGIDGHPGDTVEITLPTLIDGSSIKITHHTTSGVSLHAGRILKMDNINLPDTVSTALIGRRLADLVDLPDCAFSQISDARIVDIFFGTEDGKTMLIYTDNPTVNVLTDSLRNEK